MTLLCLYSLAIDPGFVLAQARSSEPVDRPTIVAHTPEPFFRNQAREGLMEYNVTAIDDLGLRERSSDFYLGQC
jgi:hypothetical protein